MPTCLETAYFSCVLKQLVSPRNFETRSPSRLVSTGCTYNAGVRFDPRETEIHIQLPRHSLYVRRPNTHSGWNVMATGFLIHLARGPSPEGDVTHLPKLLLGTMVLNSTHTCIARTIDEEAEYPPPAKKCILET